MIRPLRKRHLFTWIVLAILLPLGFFSAISVIPESETPDQSLFYESSNAPVQVEHTDDNFHFRLRSSLVDKSNQLEIQVKETIDHPSAFVYISQQKVQSQDQANLLGTLGPVGTYLFELDTALELQSVKTILLYDKIKEEVFYKVDL